VRHSRPVVAGLLILSACTVSSSPSGLGTIGEDGTALWASLSPGSYTTTRFEPRLSFAVEEGWYGVDADFALLLTRDNGSFTSFTLNHYAGTVTVDRCSDPEVVEAREGLSELADWVLAYEGLDVSEGEPTTIGGYPARVIDIVFAGGQRCADDKVVLGVPHSAATLWAGEFLGVDESLHAVFVDHPDGVLIITLKTMPAAIAPPEFQGSVVALEDFVELAMPVIESIEFEPAPT
jgi:hypothetical protein